LKLELQAFMGRYAFGINLKSVDTASGEIMAQLIQFLNVPVVAANVNVKEVTRSILEKADIKNIDKILAVPPPPPPPGPPAGPPGMPPGIPNNPELQGAPPGMSPTGLPPLPQIPGAPV
jgi:hypothetical protein